MLSQALSRHTEENRLIRLVLVFALLLAATHVALHNLEANDSNLDVHDECQVCRLNHVPAASLPTPSLLAPLQLLVYWLPAANTKYQLSPPLHTPWARAPPLI